MKLLLILLAILPVTLWAQNVGSNCNPDEIINLPEIYKSPGKGSVKNISKEDLSHQQAITQKLMNMIVVEFHWVRQMQPTQNLQALLQPKNEI